MGDPVLVVDDESVTRRVVTYTLKSINIEVVSAENGAQAVELGQQTAFSLVIIDINLPDIDGFEILRQLKSIPHLHKTPMIMFTARNHSGDEETALEIGASGFLYKPFSTQELRELVKKHLGQI